MIELIIHTENEKIDRLIYLCENLREAKVLNTKTATNFRLFCFSMQQQSNCLLVLFQGSAYKLHINGKQKRIKRSAFICYDLFVQIQSFNSGGSFAIYCHPIRFVFQLLLVHNWMLEWIPCISILINYFIIIDKLRNS